MLKMIPWQARLFRILILFNILPAMLLSSCGSKKDRSPFQGPIFSQGQKPQSKENVPQLPPQDVEVTEIKLLSDELPSARTVFYGKDDCWVSDDNYLKCEIKEKNANHELPDFASLDQLLDGYEVWFNSICRTKPDFIKLYVHANRSTFIKTIKDESGEDQFFKIFVSKSDFYQDSNSLSLSLRIETIYLYDDEDTVSPDCKINLVGVVPQFEEQTSNALSILAKLEVPEIVSTLAKFQYLAEPIQFLQVNDQQVHEPTLQILSFIEDLKHNLEEPNQEILDDFSPYLIYSRWHCSGKELLARPGVSSTKLVAYWAVSDKIETCSLNMGYNKDKFTKKFGHKLDDGKLSFYDNSGELVSTVPFEFNKELHFPAPHHAKSYEIRFLAANEADVAEYIYRDEILTVTASDFEREWIKGFQTSIDGVDSEGQALPVEYRKDEEGRIYVFPQEMLKVTVNLDKHFANLPLHYIAEGNICATLEITKANSDDPCLIRGNISIWPDQGSISRTVSFNQINSHGIDPSWANRKLRLYLRVKFFNLLTNSWETTVYDIGKLTFFTEYDPSQSQVLSMNIDTYFKEKNRLVISNPNRINWVTSLLSLKVKCSSTNKYYVIDIPISLLGWASKTFDKREITNRLLSQYGVSCMRDDIKLSIAAIHDMADRLVAYQEWEEDQLIKD